MDINYDVWFNIFVTAIFSFSNLFDATKFLVNQNLVCKQFYSIIKRKHIWRSLATKFEIITKKGKLVKNHIKQLVSPKSVKFGILSEAKNDIRYKSREFYKIPKNNDYMETFFGDIKISLCWDIKRLFEKIMQDVQKIQSTIIIFKSDDIDIPSIEINSEKCFPWEYLYHFINNPDDYHRVLVYSL
jgi:hypothetical protein